jgi:hypothetical protein
MLTTLLGGTGIATKGSTAAFDDASRFSLSGLLSDQSNNLFLILVPDATETILKSEFRFGTGLIPVAPGSIRSLVWVVLF